MIFDLWEHKKKPDGIVLESKVFARRQGQNIHPKYHDMKLGESRTLTDTADSEVCIVRVE